MIGWVLREAAALAAVGGFVGTVWQACTLLG